MYLDSKAKLRYHGKSSIWDSSLKYVSNASCTKCKQTFPIIFSHYFPYDNMNNINSPFVQYSWKAKYIKHVTHYANPT